MKIKGNINNILRPLSWGGVGMALLLLSSCGLYNKYERPEVNASGSRLPVPF